MSCSAWMVATIECIERSRARDSWAISAPSPTIGRSVSAAASSRSSSTPSTCRAGAAQHPAAYDVLGLGRGGLVEHRGRRCAPVDQQRVVVARRAARSGRCSAGSRVQGREQVEPAEDQALVGGVERGDPARGLEDHGVALDQAALVAESAAVVPLACQRSGVARGLLQLDVDAIDERLLRGELCRQHIVCQENVPLGSPTAAGGIPMVRVDNRIRSLRSPVQDHPIRGRRPPGEPPSADLGLSTVRFSRPRGSRRPRTGRGRGRTRHGPSPPPGPTGRRCPQSRSR